MISNNLKFILDQNRAQNPLYLRNLLKEQIQLIVLNFIYNSKYAEDFLFTGGTALRFCFGLPRLSEDLDFDVMNFFELNIQQFTEDLKLFFVNKLKYHDLKIRIAGKNQIIYLAFPILNKIGFPVDASHSSANTLFIRIDLAPVIGEGFSEEISLKSSSDFSFLIRHYSITDMFAHKIAAILLRERWQGNVKEARFKGRDYFDIFWLNSKNIKPNIDLLKSILDIRSCEEIALMLSEKFIEAGKRKLELKQDLIPYFSENEFVDQFIENFEILNKTLPLNCK